MATSRKPKKKFGAPIGNKNAVGHGRPPNPGYSDAEVIQLGEEMLQWIRDCDNNPKCDVVHLSEFYSEIKGIAYSQWKSLINDRSCFLPYYEKAKEWMGKRILKNTNLPTAYGSRFLNIYFKEIRDTEREIMKEKVDYEISKKLEMEENRRLSPNDNLLSDLINHVKSISSTKLNESNNEIEIKIKDYGSV